MYVLILIKHMIFLLLNVKGDLADKRTVEGTREVTIKISTILDDLDTRGKISQVKQDLKTLAFQENLYPNLKFH